MYNHAPEKYICPLCLAIQGIESEQTMVIQDDVFYRDDTVMALVNSKFLGNKPGHAIIIPIEHFENIYDLPIKTGHRIFEVSQQVAKALKETTQCDGVMIQQNNEPASGQHAFHYHIHLFPRYDDDDFVNAQKNVWVATDQERKPLAEVLREYFQNL